jgi:regulatory protein
MNALQIALRYLERRARTEAELRQKLTDRQVPPQEIEAVLVKMKQFGYIDDQKFAADFQRSRNDYKPTGVQRLRMELRQKGVSKDIIEQIAVEKEDEIELAHAAAKTRLRQYSNLEATVFERRMIGFLARRGFGYDVIKVVMGKIK